MPLIITVERGNLSERRMIDATDPEAIKDWLLAVEGAQNPRIEHVASIFQDQMTQFKGELAIKDYVDDVVCTIDEEEFLAKTDSNPRLTKDAATLIADKIRRTRMIPTFIPDGVTDHYEFDRWRKAFWYVPISFVLPCLITPLIVEQNGIWGLEEPGGEFTLFASFENYGNIDLAPLSPHSLAVTMAGSVGKQDKADEVEADDDWWCLTFGLDEAGPRKYAKPFFEYMPDDELGHHFLVVKAIIEVWQPYVLASKGLPAFYFDTRVFKSFEDLASLIDWAIAEDTEAELKFAASADARKETEAALEAENTSLLEDADFKDLIACAKSIAQKSGKQCLSPLLVLCAAAVTDQARVTLVEENIDRIKSIAEQQGIDLDYGERTPAERKMPLDEHLRNLVVAHKKSNLGTFLLALLADLKKV